MTNEASEPGFPSPEPYRDPIKLWGKFRRLQRFRNTNQG